MASMICLFQDQLSYASANFPLTTSKDQQVTIQLKGLNFINSTYSVATGNNTNAYQMLITNMAVSSAQTLNFSPNISLCNFGKIWKTRKC